MDDIEEFSEMRDLVSPDLGGSPDRILNPLNLKNLEDKR